MIGFSGCWACRDVRFLPAYWCCHSCRQAFWASLTKETPKFSELGGIAKTQGAGRQDSQLNTISFHTAGVQAQVLFPPMLLFSNSLSDALDLKKTTNQPPKTQHKTQTKPQTLNVLTLIPVWSGRHILMTRWWWDHRQIGVRFGQQWHCSPVLLVYSSIRG